jgi:hypothetical protein
MPGYNPATLAQNVLTGNNVAVMLGDTLISFAQTVGHTLPMGTEGLYGIGSQKPQEIQQLRMAPAFTLDSFELTANGLTLLANGQRLEYILAGNSFEMHVLEFVNGAYATLFSYVGCKAQNLSQNIPTNAPIRTTYSFLALDVLDPDGNSIMDDKMNALNVASAAASAGLAVSNLGLAGLPG